MQTTGTMTGVINAPGAPAFITIEQAAGELEVTPWVVVQRIEAGELPAARFGTLTLVSRADLERTRTPAARRGSPWWQPARRARLHAARGRRPLRTPQDQPQRPHLRRRGPHGPHPRHHARRARSRLTT